LRRASILTRVPGRSTRARGDRRNEYCLRAAGRGAPGLLQKGPRPFTHFAPCPPGGFFCLAEMRPSTARRPGSRQLLAYAAASRPSRAWSARRGRAPLGSRNTTGETRGGSASRRLDDKDLVTTDSAGVKFPRCRLTAMVADAPRQPGRQREGIQRQLPLAGRRRRYGRLEYYRTQCLPSDVLEI